MIRELRHCAEQHQLFGQGDRITVALSGGADSVCLLLCLCALREDMDLHLKAVHVHHGLRGEAADGDAAFCADLCERLGVPLEVEHINAAALAKEHHQSTEEAGRNARYAILRKAAQGGWIAVAHHSDDQCETILHNIIRGTGIKGLAGMDYKSGDIIRPLLDADRTGIEAWLRKQGETWREDASNREDCYTRNRIRNTLLPYMEEQINAGVRRHLLSLGEQARELMEEPETAAEKLKIREDLIRIAGTGKDITAAHVNGVYELGRMQVGRRLNLPYGITAVRDYDGVHLEKKREAEDSAEGADRASERGELPSPEETCSVFAAEKPVKIPEKEFTKWFDYDKIIGPLCWRYRTPGDYLELDGVGRKKVKEYLIDRKIPAGERDRIPLLADGSHILWIPGLRISSYYKVSETTTHILEVTYDWREKHEHGKSSN